MGTKSSMNLGFTFLAFFRIARDCRALVTETAVSAGGGVGVFPVGFLPSGNR